MYRIMKLVLLLRFTFTILLDYFFACCFVVMVNPNIDESKKDSDLFNPMQRCLFIALV